MRGIGAVDGSAAPFRIISEMLFRGRPAFETAMEIVGARLLADLPNYTDLTPILQFSELVAV